LETVETNFLQALRAPHEGESEAFTRIYNLFYGPELQ
jgi:hypothetical protein